MSKKFSEIYEQSIKNPENFWQEASNDIFWFKKPTKILNKSNPPFYKWQTADQRAEVFSKGNKLDAKLVELSLKTRTIKLSVRAAEEDAQKSLIRKFGENAAKSGGTLKDILSSALGGKKKKKEEK